MKWFKQKLRNWINHDSILVSAKGQDCSPLENSHINGKGFTLRVFRANGGTVVETSSYDDHRDRHVRGLHVIMDNEDIGEKLGKIITYESLKA